MAFAATLAGGALLALYLVERRHSAHLAKLLAAERRGRTGAERQLCEAADALELARASAAAEAPTTTTTEAPATTTAAGSKTSTAASSSTAAVAATARQCAAPALADYPPVTLHVLGRLRSCFSTRNGTPRQPGAVPSARATLHLRPDLNACAALDGVAQFSHVWIVFLFHANTDRAKRAAAAGSARPTDNFRAKISPPLHPDGAKVGVFATRSPHRFNAVGLSVVRLESVSADGVMHLRGADLVDGTPVLDIKPYHPRFDAVRDAWAPSWVGGGVVFAHVRVTDAARAAVERCAPRLGLYRADPAAYEQLIVETLRLDVRSAHGRALGRSEHSVVLDGARVSFGIEGGEIEVRSVEMVAD
jgi:tRNA-Thr(GGU) m(6)t(6)A37 methyltransferase TsaA